MHRPQCPEGRLTPTEHTVLKTNESQPNAVTKVKETNISPRYFVLKSTHTGRNGGQKNQELTLSYTLMTELGRTVWGPCVYPPRRSNGARRLWSQTSGWDLGAPRSSCVNGGALSNFSGPGDKLAPTPGGVWDNEEIYVKRLRQYQALSKHPINVFYDHSYHNAPSLTQGPQTAAGVG